MAELVHLRLEHGLTELEEMERISLFKREEIRKIAKRRKLFEYRLRRRMKKKEDFLQYIEFEICLLQLISKRRLRLLIESKKKEIDNSIAKKVSRLFKAVISRYPEDEHLWLNQIEYFKRMKWNDSINALYTKLLQVHSKKPRLWVMAANWEMENNHSFDNARGIFQRGVLMNPKSEVIWREYFKMELKYIEMIRKRREVLKLQNMKDDCEGNDAVLRGEIVNVVYDNAVEEIPDVEFALSFIQICFEFDFASKNVDHILKIVQRKFPDKEETLDALAKKPLLNVSERIKKVKSEGPSKKVIYHEICDEIYSKYEEAVEILPTEKMWKFYLDFLSTMLESSTARKRKVKQQSLLIDKMKKAVEKDCLSVEYHIRLIEMLMETGDEEGALCISLLGTRKWNTVSLWSKCLQLHIQCRKSKDTIYCLFIEAVSLLMKNKDAILIWRLGIDWLSISDPSKLSEFFEKGLSADEEINLPLKEMYLEATALRNGIESAHQLYRKFKKMGPLSYELIQKIIKIEKAQLKPCIKRLRSYYEDAVNRFGSSNVDVWLEYMHFGATYVKEDPEALNMIIRRGYKTLHRNLLGKYEKCLTMYRTGYVNNSKKN